MGSADATGTEFGTTSWTLVRRAQVDPEALERLLTIYWRPMYGYLRRTGSSRHDAAELTQAFICDVMLDRELVQRANSEAGRFRSFVLAALKRFAIDAHRREHGRTGRRAKVLALADEHLLGLADPGDGETAEGAFNRQWAATILSETIRRCEAECRSDGMELHWQAFAMRHLDPLRGASDAPSLDIVARRIGVSGPARVSHMIENVKRRLQAIERRIVGETVDTPRDLDRELAELRRALEGT